MNNCCCGQEPLTIKIKQGESKGFSFSLTQNDIPVDLSNSTIVLQVRESLEDTGEYLISKTISINSDVDEDGIIFSPTTGEFLFKINDTDIAEMNSTRPYYCAIYRVDDDTKVCISAPDFQSALFLVLNP